MRELGDRGLATDELNRRVDQLFQEHDINVSTTPAMNVTLSRRIEKHAEAEAEVEVETVPAKEKAPVPEAR
ncbi:hypothetical protein D3C86_2018540 [compost metagenome]